MLNCSADGFPVPDIMWTVELYDGEIPTFNITEERTSLQVTGYITILNVSPLDTANYTCNASNTLGSSTAQVFVEVLCK